MNLDESPCIPWIGRLTRDGYGQFGVKLAHRLVWEKVHGPIPDGLTVDHLCFRRDCINPWHMQLLTAVQNSRCRSGTRKPQKLRTHCKRNHEFTEDNTYIRADGMGRACRACARDNTRRYNERKVA